MEAIRSYLILYNNSILNALKQLDAVSDNGMLTLFVIDESNHVIGSLTDGDCRRSLIKGAALSDPIATVMRNDFT